MMCPVCQSETSVKDSRQSSLNTIRRRRVCENGHKMTTWESAVDPKRAIMEADTSKKPRYVTSRERKQMREMRAAGNTIAEIRKQFPHWHYCTVFEHIRDVVLPGKGKPGRKRSFDYAEIARLKDNGLTGVDIARRFGCSEGSVSKAIRVYRAERAA